MRIALGIHYNGTGFSGWQSQQHGNTVQQTLEKALGKFSGVNLSTTVAGRTDAGVHGLGQVVHFDTALKRADFSWIRGVNAFLPKSVAIQWAQGVTEDFHARFSAFERTYYYVLYVHPVRMPILEEHCGWLHTPLDVEVMHTAAQVLIGKHDFSAFRSSDCQAKTPIKHMYAIDVAHQGCFYIFRFRANAFLHRMVRNIMGCLTTVGRGRQPPEWIGDVLSSGDRREAAPTFMPNGLYLAHIAYPTRFAIPAPNWSVWPFPMPWNV
ncbi:tRNA pseudouridine(38-40) synthase TruA [Candidatus Pandoraea novymonadis]|uniref:tRNA pseudouridine synthase A n=1 Tax=Candidatus Pandoraea novymonadis TaxID=1808959 RepID=A0ABX5FFF3_9BURK|nr:tRNA pseudouridine(38-40) synthase TruA [Candidatus Pandoraea novymonadis]PSB92203.1 tRNA pseudouridine synthase A [Candidatus Pandoraea novymonadis]